MSFFRKKYSTLLLLTLLIGVLSPLTAAEKTVILRKYDFNKGTFGWITPGYWTGKSSHNAANGTMTLTPESRNGSPIYGKAYTQSGLTDVRGLKLELSCRVRGSGKVRLGAYFAVMNGKNSKWVYGDMVTLTGEWQQNYLKSETLDRFLQRIQHRTLIHFHLQTPKWISKQQRELKNISNQTYDTHYLLSCNQIL